MNGESGSSSAQDIEFLAKVAAFWKAKDSQLEGSKQFGRFVIKKCLGQGGFGIVYLAFDPLVGREVAIKVPGVQSLFDESRINRFLSEAKHLGALAHPNIAQVYEASEVGGLCYITMKYYSDGSLAEWIRSQSKPPTFKVVLDIFKQIVAGVATAHSAGLIHRDLKPSNILLDLSNFESGTEEVKIVPCVADFGLAKNLLESHLSKQTAENTRIGTVGFAAPEQWRDSRLVSTASDVYSLGAILLNMFSAGHYHEYEASLSECTSSLRARSDLPFEVVQICLRCLHDDPKERYVDAGELKRHLELVLADDVKTVPSSKLAPSTHFPTAKSFSRQKPAKARAAVAMNLVALVAIGVYAWSSMERVKKSPVLVNGGYSEQTRMPRELLAREYALGIRSVFETISSDSTVKRRKSLDQVQTLIRNPMELPFEAKYLRHLPDRSRMVPIGFGNTHLVLGLLSCPGRPIVAMQGPSNDIVLFDIEENRFLRRLEGLSSQQRHFAFSPDGQILAGSSLSPGNSSKVLEILVWDVASGKRIAAMDTVVYSEHIFSLQFLNADQLLLAGHFEDGHRLKVVSVSEKRLLGNDAMEEVKYSDDGFENIVLLNDMRENRLFSAIEKSTKRIAFLYIDKATKATSTRVTPRQVGVFCGANGRFVAYVEASQDLHSISSPETNRMDQKLVVWDPRNGSTVFEKDLKESVTITAITLSQDGESVLSIDATGLLRIDRVKETPLKQVTDAPSPKEVWSVDFHPERKQLLSAIDGGMVSLHSTEKTKYWPLHSDQLATTVQWRPKSSEQFASAGFDNAARVWKLVGDMPELLLECTHPAKVRCLAFSSSGDLLATGCDDGKIRVWNLAQSECVATLSGHGEKIRCLAFSEEGAQLISGANDRQIIRWSVADFNQMDLEPVTSNPTCCAFSPVGDRFVFGTQAGMLCMRSTKDPSFRMDLVASTEQIRSVAISKDGETVATGSQDGTISLWNLDTGIKLADFAKEQSAILSLSFSHDNESLSAGLYSGTIVTWDVNSTSP